MAMPIVSDLDSGNYLDPLSNSNRALYTELNGYDSHTLVAIINSGQGERVKSIARELYSQRVAQANISPSGPIAMPSYGNVSGTYADTRGTYGDYRGAYGNPGHTSFSGISTMRSHKTSVAEELEDDQIMLTRYISPELRIAQEKALEADFNRNLMTSQEIQMGLRPQMPQMIFKSEAPEINLKPKEPSKLLIKAKKFGVFYKNYSMEFYTACKTGIKRDITDPFLHWLKA